jgi:tetratricopeptide (TPR) repeat protein
MTKHLSQKNIEDYRQRKMAPTDLLIADEHLASCDECLNKLAQPEKFHLLLSAFAHDLPQTKHFEADHLAYEQLADYIDGRLDEVEREIADVHLAVCRVCEEDLKALASLKESPAIAVEKSYAFPQWLSRLFSFSPEIPLFSQPIVQFAGAAVVLLFFGGLIWFLLQTRQPNQEIAQIKQPETEITNTSDSQSSPFDNQSGEANLAVNENQQNPTEEPNSNNIVANNGGKTTLNKGDLNGLENIPSNYRQLVENALKSQNIEISPEARELKRKSGILMSGGEEGISFAVENPVGKIIQTTRPQFRWQPLAGATSYSVNLYDTNFNKVAASEQLTATNWTLTTPLKRGTVYLWQVTAVKGGQEIKSPTLPAPEARFKVLDKARNDEIERVKRQNPRSHLLLGILYAKAGLIDEAEREFNLLLKENPKSKSARNFLQKLRASNNKGKQTKLLLC